MALGHFAMAFEPLLHVALGLLVIGNGFFKPNISTLLGSLYREHDPRRDAGFTIFYIGVNTGGSSRRSSSARSARRSAGTTASRRRRRHAVRPQPVPVRPEQARRSGLSAGSFESRQPRLDRGRRHRLRDDPARLLGLAGWGVVGPVWRGLGGLGQLVLVIAIIAVLWFVGRARGAKAGHETAVARGVATHRRHRDHGALRRVLLMGFEQAGGTMSLFADTKTDRELFGWQMPASLFQAINPLAIITLGPCCRGYGHASIGSRYAFPRRRRWARMIILGLGFILLAIADGRADTIGKVSPLWLFAVYVITRSASCSCRRSACRGDEARTDAARRDADGSLVHGQRGRRTISRERSRRC